MAMQNVVNFYEFMLTMLKQIYERYKWKIGKSF